jgi:hypothetical protein
MQLEIDPAVPTRVRPSCSTPGLGIATPPRRIVQAAQALDRLGARTTVQSICEADLSPAFDAVMAEIVDAISGFPQCFHAPPEHPEECVLHELLPPEAASRCADLPGRREAGARTYRGVLHERCEIAYVAPGEEGPGWTLERGAGAPEGSAVADACGEGAWVRFLGEPEPSDSAVLYFACPVRTGPDGGTCEPLDDG